MGASHAPIRSGSALRPDGDGGQAAFGGNAAIGGQDCGVASRRRSDTDPEQAVLPLVRIIEDNLAAFAGKDEIVPADVQAQLGERSRSALAALMPWLEARARGGFVRQCHGDLHLRNIVEIEGEPVLFDALEFDDRLATIDVLYDLAFLLMDLGARGLVDHANAVLNAYLETSGDTANLIGLKTLPLFLSMRAMIRAKVELLRSEQGPKQNRDEARARAHGYFLLARDYLEIRAPRLISIGGLSGSGKSTVARMLAPRIGSFPGAVHIRSDAERKRMFGVPFDAKLPPSAYALEVTGPCLCGLRETRGACARRRPDGDRRCGSSERGGTRSARCPCRQDRRCLHRDLA